MKRVLISLAIVALLAVAAGFAATLKIDRFMNTAMAIPDGGVAFELPPGTSFAAMSQQLVSMGAIESDMWFRWYARWHDEASQIQAGEYWIERGTSPAALLQQLTQGSVRLYTFTIIDGWNHRDLLKALHSNDAIQATMTHEDWPELLQAFGAEVRYPEGMFLPESYRFPRGTTDKALLRQAYDLLQEVLAEEWQGRSESAPAQSPYEALILASIVEKETARADERGKIAGVFARRLATRMRLQTDPTVIYGIGASFDGNLTRKHLRTDTPYNTYTRGGLPPTPIAMAGRAAIHAALHPEDGTEMYFVATGLGDGSHKFSTTKDEHDAAVAEYLRRLRQNRAGS